MPMGHTRWRRQPVEADGNLVGVQPLTPQDKVEAVNAYRASGQSQAEFCATWRGGGIVAERTLRSWVAALTKPGASIEEARRIVSDAVTRLNAILAGLDAVALVQDEAPSLAQEPDEAAAAGGRAADVAPAVSPPEAAAAIGQVADDSSSGILTGLQGAMAGLLAAPTVEDAPGPAAPRRAPFPSVGYWP